MAVASPARDQTRHLDPPMIADQRRRFHHWSGLGAQHVDPTRKSLRARRPENGLPETSEGARRRFPSGDATLDRHSLSKHCEVTLDQVVKVRVLAAQPSETPLSGEEELGYCCVSPWRSRVRQKKGFRYARGTLGLHAVPSPEPVRRRRIIGSCRRRDHHAGTPCRAVADTFPCMACRSLGDV